MARCGGLVGVGEHIKGRKGKHGNTGEPNVSTRMMCGTRSTARTRDRVVQGTCCPCINDKNKQQALSGILTEGNRREGEGRRQS